LPWEVPENALAALTGERVARGDVIDLTESNPTRVGLPYPDEALRTALARADASTYAPTPLGLPSARAAVAEAYARAGEVVDPADVILTASSSESYGFLFKLCCDPGDAVLVPEPSYPLFEYLARLEGVSPVPYRLAYDGVWHVDFASVADALARARAQGTRPRALVVVNPNNPTGSFLKRDELARLADVAGVADLAIISDEVFAGYPTLPTLPTLPASPDPTRVTTVAIAPEMATAGPAFSLGGLSKACGLPQLKLGWIVVGGREAARARAALELIADTYLSVATPVQNALPALFTLGDTVRAAIAARVAENRATLAAALPPGGVCSLLPSEAGWSAIVRVPATRSDEAWAAGLLTEAGVLLHPGYFFDLRGGTFLVASLLPPVGLFAEATRRLLAHVR
jgi:aspartate/methionine/tyrosine aminotransferase